MSGSTIHDILRETFPISNQADWKHAASQELPEKISIENLTWKVDGLNFYPYYISADVDSLQYLTRYHHRFAAAPYHSAGSWDNLPKIKVGGGSEANASALEHLALGADGVLFDIAHYSDHPVNVLLEKIDWPYCNLSFLLPADIKIATKIFAYILQKKYDLTTLSGSLFWKTLPDISDLKSLMMPAMTGFHTLGITVPAASPTQEISTFLQQGVMLMDSMTATDKNLAFKAISVSFSCEENLFVSIAKLKAARILWYQVSQVYKISNFSPEDLHIHALSEKWNAESFQPHANMIKNTVDALGAILGGCNALTLVPDGESAMAHRTARNISNILKEESNLDKVADVVSGAYAIENMVHELSQAAWKDFQTNVRV
jgi:methylmalonyl-CoA mutase